MKHTSPQARTPGAVIALMVILAAGCATIEPVTPPPAEPAPSPSVPPVATAEVPRVAGYHAYWTGEAWQEYPYDVLDAIFFFDLEVGSEGRIENRHGWPDRWIPMQRHARARGTAVHPVVSIMNADAFVALLESDAAQASLRQEILALFTDNPDMDGVHLDFEVFRPVPAGVREAMTRFAQQLDRDLQAAAPGKLLSMFLLATDASDVFDETALAAAMDFVVVQGYDLHARNDEQAGPVAAPTGWRRRNWETIVARYRDLGVPREKILMAVPYFGYEWSTESEELRSRTRGAGVSTMLANVDTAYVGTSRRVAPLRAAEFGLKRDPESGVPYYTWTDSTGAFQGWFDDAESLEAKYAYIQDAGLRGVAIFPLGYGDEALSGALRRAFERR